MVSKDDSRPGSASVIRGPWGTPAHEPSTIRRRNRNAVAAIEATAHERMRTGEALKRSEGYVFRATEIWQKTSPTDREQAEKLLVEYILADKTVEDIAWEFVHSTDDAHMKCDAHRAAYARAFLIIVYGEDPTSH